MSDLLDSGSRGMKFLFNTKGSSRSTFVTQLIGGLARNLQFILWILRYSHLYNEKEKKSPRKTRRDAHAELVRL